MASELPPGSAPVPHPVGRTRRGCRALRDRCLSGRPRSTSKQATAQRSGTRPNSAGELQRRLADGPGPVDVAGAAQRRGQHHLALGAVPRRPAWSAASSTAASALRTASAPSPAAIASSAATQARRTASRCGASATNGSARRQQRRRGGQPPDAQRVGRQPGQRVAGGLGVVAGQRQRATVPAASQLVPAQLAQKRRLCAMRQRGQPPAGAARSSAARSLRALP